MNGGCLGEELDSQERVCAVMDQVRMVLGHEGSTIGVFCSRLEDGGQEATPPRMGNQSADVREGVHQAKLTLLQRGGALTDPDSRATPGRRRRGAPAVR